MNISAVEDLSAFPSIHAVRFAKDSMSVSLSDGRIVSVPIAWYPRLALAHSKQLKKFKISPSGYGIHWPELGEDLSVCGFLFPRGREQTPVSLGAAGTRKRYPPR